MLLPPDAELVRRDPAVPGLATLLEPEAFLAALSACRPEADFESARITYVKYKPGTNCLVGYQLEVAGALLDVYAKAYPRTAQNQLRKAREQSGVPGPLGPGRIVLEDCMAVVAIFPNDSKVKGLIPLTDPEIQKRLLRELVPERPDLWESAVQSLRYKPERRYIAKLLIEGGARAVLRVYTEPDYHRVQGNAKAFGSRGPLRLARWLGRSDRHRILAFEWLPGRPLSEAISGHQLAFEAVAAVGAALAELHAQNPQGLARRTREAETATLLEAAAGLGFVCPQLVGRAHNLARRLAVHLAHEPLGERPIHGDFYAGQVLLADDIVAILDFDEAARGDPAADLGNFIAHLESDALRGYLPPGRVKPLRDALLEGYRIATHHAILAQIDVYTAAGLFRLAPHPFRCRELDWPERTEAILERSEAILKGIPQHSRNILRPVRHNGGIKP